MFRTRKPTAIVASAALGLACASSVEVGFDRNADFAAFRSWEFAESARPRVRAGRDAGGLDGELARLIGTALEGHGYRRGGDRVDFRVGFDLELERRSEVVSVPIATRLVSSNDYTPSYWVGGTDTEERHFEVARLVIEVFDRDGRVVWKGVFCDRFEPGQRPDLVSAVRELLERFPRAQKRETPREERPDRLAWRERPSEPARIGVT